MTFSLKDVPAGAPSVFAIATPPRLVLDFPNTTSVGKATNDVTDSVLRSYNVVQAQGRTRVLLNLTKSQSYEMKSDGKKLSVALFDAPGAAAADSAPSGAFHWCGKSRRRDVWFARRRFSTWGRSGERAHHRRPFQSNAGVDIKPQGKTLVVDFLRTQVPRNLERKLDGV